MNCRNLQNVQMQFKIWKNIICIQSIKTKYLYRCFPFNSPSGTHPKFTRAAHRTVETSHRSRTIRTGNRRRTILEGGCIAGSRGSVHGHATHTECNLIQVSRVHVRERTDDSRSLPPPINTSACFTRGLECTSATMEPLQAFFETSPAVTLGREPWSKVWKIEESDETSSRLDRFDPPVALRRRSDADSRTFSTNKTR